MRFINNNRQPQALHQFGMPGGICVRRCATGTEFVPDLESRDRLNCWNSPQAGAIAARIAARPQSRESRDGLRASLISPAVT